MERIPPLESKMHSENGHKNDSSKFTAFTFIQNDYFALWIDFCCWLFDIIVIDSQTHFFFYPGDVNGDDASLDEMNLFSAPNSTVAEPKESVSRLIILW